jgi:hypothetical protein
MGRFEQICAVLAFVVIAMFATSAHAQRWNQSPPPPAAADDPAAPAGSQPWREAKERLPAPDYPGSEIRERTWYGWQTLIADALGIGLIVFGDESDIIFVGIGVLGLGAPLVHFAHANVDGGLISLAIRAGSIGLLVLGGALVGNAIFDDRSSSSETRNTFGAVLIVASIVGGLTGLIVDAAVLGYETKTRKRDYSTTSVAPWFDPARGSYGVRVGLTL